MLKEIRQSRGLSQSQLAEKSGLTVRTLQHYEQGSRSIDGAKLNTLIDLATALNCSVSDILISEELKEKCKKATF